MPWRKAGAEDEKKIVEKGTWNRSHKLLTSKPSTVSGRSQEERSCQHPHSAKRGPGSQPAGGKVERTSSIQEHQELLFWGRRAGEKFGEALERQGIHGPLGHVLQNHTKRGGPTVGGIDSELGSANQVRTAQVIILHPRPQLVKGKNKKPSGQSTGGPKMCSRWMRR